MRPMRLSFPDEVGGIIADEMGFVRKFKNEETVKEMALDSLERVEIIIAFQDNYDIEIDEHEADMLLAPTQTLEGMAERIWVLIAEK